MMNQGIVPIHVTLNEPNCGWTKKEACLC